MGVQIYASPYIGYRPRLARTRCIEQIHRDLFPIVTPVGTWLTVNNLAEALLSVEPHLGQQIFNPGRLAVMVDRTCIVSPLAV